MTRQELTQGFLQYLSEHHALTQVGQGKSLTFGALKIFLRIEDTRGAIIRKVAQKPGIGVASMKTLIQCLRKHHAPILRHEVVRIVADPADIDDVIHALFDPLLADEGAP